MISLGCKYELLELVAGDYDEICLIFLVVIFNFHPGIKHIIIVVITNNCDLSRYTLSLKW